MANGIASVEGAVCRSPLPQNTRGILILHCVRLVDMVTSCNNQSKRYEERYLSIAAAAYRIHLLC